MDYYIYAYLDPRKTQDGLLSHEPFYIGRGKGDRLNSHLTEAKKYPEMIPLEFAKRKRINLIKINKIRKIWSEHLNPIIVKLEENLSFEESKQREIYWISLFGRSFDGSGTLTNLTCGGEGRIVCQSGRFNSFYGKTHSIETKKKISLIHKGKTLSVEHKNKISASLTGTKKSFSARERYRRSMMERAKNPDDPSIKALREAKSKTWLLLTPEKDQILVTSLQKFCNEHNLNSKSLMNTLSSKLPISRGSSMGWMIIERYD